MELTLIEIALVIGVMIAGSAVQGSVGFGMGLLSVPLLFHIDPLFVPAPSLICALILNLMITRRDWGHADVREVGWAIAGRLPGSIVGAYALMVVSAQWIGPMFGAMILIAVILTALGLHLERTRRTLVTAGFISGIFATIVSIGGPPMALIYQRESGPRIRSSMSLYFIVGIAISLTCLFAVGRLGMPEVMATGVMLPGVFIGFFVSGWLAKHLDRGHTRRAVLSVAALTGLSVIVRWLMGGG